MAELPCVIPSVIPITELENDSESAFDRSAG